MEEQKMHFHNRSAITKEISPIKLDQDEIDEDIDDSEEV
jgi:hypothetical protein